MVTTKMNWSGLNVIHFARKSQFGRDQFMLVVTISFWLWPNHYGQVQINLVRPKPFWSDQNCFGHIEGLDISQPKVSIFGVVALWRDYLPIFPQIRSYMWLFSALMMSWVRVWIDLDLFTTHFSDKVFTRYMKVKRIWIR